MSSQPGPPSRISGLRTLRLIVVCVAVGTIANSAANIIGFNANAARVQQINDERAANVRRSCEDTNGRHDATIRQLRELVDGMPPGVRRTRAREGMAGTIALIEALAPKRDCGALVETQVDTR